MCRITDVDGLESRFWEKVDKGEPDECWEWESAMCSQGRGNISVDGSPKMAHRVSWAFEEGKDPGEQYILHDCGNPACVNPGHLTAGDESDRAESMVKYPRLHNEEWLREQYEDLERSLTDIANEVGCVGETVRARLGEINVGRDRARYTEYDRLDDEEWLREKYTEEELSMEEIAELVGCSHSNVVKRINDHGIPSRDMGEELAKGRTDYRDKDWLHGKYITEGLTTHEIADELGASSSTISDWLSRHEIPVRDLSKSATFKCKKCGSVEETTPSCAEERKFCSHECYSEWVSGENSYLWRGGERPEYYGDSWSKQRRKTLKRDQHRCQRCGKTAGDLGRNPDVHHIIPFKLFGIENHEEANHLRNVISVCRDCHIGIEKNELPVGGEQWN